MHSGTWALNWLPPYSLSSALDDATTMHPEVALNYQTSVINVSTNSMALYWHVMIDHKGFKGSYAFSQELLDNAIASDDLNGFLYSCLKSMAEKYWPGDHIPLRLIDLAMSADSQASPYSNQLTTYEGVSNSIAGFTKALKDGLITYNTTVKNFENATLSFKIDGVQAENFKVTWGWPQPTGNAHNAKLLPGVDRFAKHPVTGKKELIYYIIMNLNDEHKWTREQIADWLETLDVDLSFAVQSSDTKEIEQ